MGPAFSFIFWMMLIGFIALTSIPFAIIFIVGRKKKSKMLKWLGGAPAAMILGGAFSLFCFIIYGFIHPWSETSDPKNITSAFVSNFGFDPKDDFVPLSYLAISTTRTL